MADEQANQVHDFPRQFFAACASSNGSKTLPDFAAPPCKPLKSVTTAGRRAGGPAAHTQIFSVYQ